MPPRSAHAQPLSDDEFDALADFLDDHSPFDSDALFGVLHAVAVAPSIIAPSTWLPLVVPNGLAKDDLFAVHLLLRLHNEVIDTLERGEVIVPTEDALEACVSFASGYAAAAALDPQWIGDDDRWTFASAVAYFADRRDLVPPHTLAKLDALPDAKDTMRRFLGATVATTYESFLKVRRSAIHAQAHPAPVPRVGRNEPCPCGSGKKFKRCCIDRPAVVNPD